MGGTSGSSGSASESEELIGCGPDVFAEESIREIFLSKVYGLYAGHLLAALGIVLMVSESDNFQSYMASHPGWIWMIILAPLLVLYISHRLSECRRTCPLDYVFLAIFTLALGFSAGMMLALTGGIWAILLLGFLAAMAINLALYSLLAKCDTSWMATTGLTLAVLALAMSTAVMYKPDAWRTVLKTGGLAYLDILYVLYITDTMVSPGYVYELCPEEYPFATLNIYVDVVRLIAAFWNALSGSDDGMECDVENA